MTREGVSYPRLDPARLIDYLNSEDLRGKTLEFAQIGISRLAHFFACPEYKQNRDVFVLAHSTPLFCSRDGNTNSQDELAKIFDELANTYDVLQQIVKQSKGAS